MWHRDKKIYGKHSISPRVKAVGSWLRYFSGMAILLIMIYTTGCSMQKATKPAENVQTLQHVQDGTGTTVDYMYPVRKVVTLTSADTDLLHLLGVTPVGGVVSDDIPPSIQAELAGIPSIGTAANVNLETLLSMKPDMVLGIAQNFQTRLRQPLGQSGIPAFFRSANSVDDVFNYIETVGKMTNTEDKTLALVNSYKTTLQDVRALHEGTKPRILILYVTPGGMRVAGEKTYLSDLFTKLGAINMTSTWKVSTENVSASDAVTGGFFPLDMERVAATPVDRILIVNHAAQGHGDASLMTLLESPSWQAIPAIRDKQYVLLEKDYFGTIPVARMNEVFRLGAEKLYNGL